MDKSQDTEEDRLLAKLLKQYSEGTSRDYYFHRMLAEGVDDIKPQFKMILVQNDSEMERQNKDDGA